MRCYRHHKEEAIGMCKVCNKGVCELCAVEKDGFIFCKDHAKMPEVVEKVEFEALAPMRAVRPAPPQHARAAPAPLPRKPRIPKVPLRVKARSTMLPAVVGGIISGTIMGMPFLNIPCMIWMMLGGAAAAYFLILNQDAVERVDGYINERVAATVGGISGVFGASIAMVISLFMAVNFSELISGGIATISDRGTAGIITQIVTTDPNLNVASLLIKYIVMLVVFPIFGVIGGILVAKFVR